MLESKLLTSESQHHIPAIHSHRENGIPQWTMTIVAHRLKFVLSGASIVHRKCHECHYQISLFWREFAFESRTTIRQIIVSAATNEQWRNSWKSFYSQITRELHLLLLYLSKNIPFHLCRPFVSIIFSFALLFFFCHEFLADVCMPR